MSCGLDTYRHSVGSFAFVLNQILHRKAKLASRRLRFLRSGGVMARFTVVNLILALLLRAGVELTASLGHARLDSTDHAFSAAAV